LRSWPHAPNCRTIMAKWAEQTAGARGRLYFFWDTVECELAISWRVRLTGWKGDRLFLYTQKTGVPVNVKLPPFVVEALGEIPQASNQYFFWTGKGKRDTAAGNWRPTFRTLFRLAAIKDGHPHRFRDTFAVELLMSGVPLERVSVLLGHTSIRVTEKHYAPWIRARQEQLEADLERSWARDPVVLAETKGTAEVHEKKEVVN
jgi:integrase